MSATLAAISGAAALGSAIYGAIASSQANNKARKLIQQQRDDSKRWYETRMSQDYTMRPDVQAAFKRQREILDEQYKRAQASKVVAGGTEESVATQKEAAARSLAQTTTDVAAQAAQYKDNVEHQYRAQDAALNQQQAQNYQQQAQAAAAAAGQAVNAGVGLLGNEIAGGQMAAGVTSTPGHHANNPITVPADSDFTPKTITPAQPVPYPTKKTY